MKKSNWVLYVDGILGVIVSIGGGIMCLYVAQDAEDTAGLIGMVCFGIFCLIGGPWLF